MRLGLGQTLTATPDGQAAERRVARELFPLPHVVEETVHDPTLSRCCQRRIQRRAHRQNSMNETVDALNQLYNFCSDSGKRKTGNDGSVSAAQVKSLEFVEHCIQQLGPPGDITDSGALEALRVTEGYEDLPSSSTLGSYNPALVSLPDGEVQPCGLADLWGEGGQMKVKEFIDEQLVSKDEALQKIDAIGPKTVYTDPKLRVRKTYVEFLGRLKKLGLVDFSKEEAVENVGVFFVKKKQNKLRLILDCRRSNHWFGEPSHVSLTTGESLRRISIDHGDELHVCSADLANAFYTLSMPLPLRKFFGLQRVRAGDVEVEEIDGIKVGKNEMIQPRVAVLPMGWSWALHWCQILHERVAERSGLTPGERLQDFKAAPMEKFWHIQYVDNLHVMGTDKQEVLRRFRTAVGELRRCGLTVHEVEELGENTKILGWEYEKDGSFRPSRQRIWRLRVAVRAVLRRGRITGHQLERLLGHMAFASLGKREMFSMLGECYTFVQRHRSAEVPIWKSVRKELSCWERLSPLIVQDLACGFCSEVVAVDASEWGLGAVASHFNIDEVKVLSSFNERWRFKSEVASNARQYTFMEDEKIRTSYFEEFEKDNVTLGSNVFTSVPFSAVDRNWKMVGRVQWKQEESMPVLESRAALFGVKHLIRKKGNHGTRMLVLTDSMTSACAVSKGRAQTWRLRTVVQKIGALLLATGSSLSMRWVPSEWNPSDGPSRGLLGPSVPCRVPGDDPLAPAVSKLGSDRQKETVFAGTVDPVAWPGEPGQTCCAADMGHRVGREEKPQQKDSQSSQTKSSRYSRGGDGSPQVGVRGQSHQRALREDVWRSGELCSTQPTGDVKSTGCRRSSGSLPREQVLGGGRHVNGELCSRRHHTLQTGAQRASWPSKDAAGSEGLEKAVSSSVEDAPTVRGGGAPSDSCLQEEDDRSGLSPVAELLPLPASNRIPGTQSGGCGQASEAGSRSLQMVELSTSPNGAWSAVENRAVGRISDLGSGLSTIPWTSHLCYDESEEATEGRLCVQHLAPGPDSVPRAELARAELGAFGGASPISASSWRSLPRGRQPPSNHKRSSSPRTMADNQVSEELREGGPHHSTVCRPNKKRAKPKRRRRQKAQPNVPSPALNPGRSLQSPVFVEIFSGTGRLGRCIGRLTGWLVLLWDITLGPEYDLTKRSNQHLLFNWVRSGLIVGAHLGLPCNSFSRARDQPGGPPPLRSDAQPLGLDNLQPGDALKVQVGNSLLRFSTRFLLLCFQLFVSCTLENPARSRVWICPPMFHFLRRRAVQNVLTEFCAYGTAWRKSTRIVGVHIDLSPVGSMRCIGSKRGLCLFTGCPHLPLSGQVASGEWRTKIAEPYPWKMCRLLARCFLNHEIQQIARSFARHSNLP